MKKRKPIPFDFVLDHLHQMQTIIKPMFGTYALYIEKKIVLILRKKETQKEDNGVWIATMHQYHQSLKNDFPSLRAIGVLGSSESNWQLIPEDADDFEESVIRVCEFIIRGDSRIGKIPNQKLKRK